MNDFSGQIGDWRLETGVVSEWFVSYSRHLQFLNDGILDVKHLHMIFFSVCFEAVKTLVPDVTRSAVTRPESRTPSPADPSFRCSFGKNVPPQRLGRSVIDIPTSKTPVMQYPLFLISMHRFQNCIPDFHRACFQMVAPFNNNNWEQQSTFNTQNVPPSQFCKSGRNSLVEASAQFWEMLIVLRAFSVHLLCRPIRRCDTFFPKAPPFKPGHTCSSICCVSWGSALQGASAASYMKNNIGQIRMIASQLTLHCVWHRIEPLDLFLSIILLAWKVTIGIGIIFLPRSGVLRGFVQANCNALSSGPSKRLLRQFLWILKKISYMSSNCSLHVFFSFFKDSGVCSFFNVEIQTPRFWNTINNTSGSMSLLSRM